MRINFDGDSPSWPAVRLGKSWNGWAVPYVTPATRDAIAVWLETKGDPSELRALAIDDDGLVKLDCGLTFYAAMEHGDSFIAQAGECDEASGLDAYEIVCPLCCGERELDLSRPTIEVWEVGSSGWTEPPVCSTCRSSIPVIVDGGA